MATQRDRFFAVLSVTAPIAGAIFALVYALVK
jgi:hypothetical protein